MHFASVHQYLSFNLVISFHCDEKLCKNENEEFIINKKKIFNINNVNSFCTAAQMFD